MISIIFPVWVPWGPQGRKLCEVHTGPIQLSKFTLSRFRHHQFHCWGDFAALSELLNCLSLFFSEEWLVSAGAPYTPLALYSEYTVFSGWVLLDSAFMHSGLNFALVNQEHNFPLWVWAENGFLPWCINLDTITLPLLCAPIEPGVISF